MLVKVVAVLTLLALGLFLLKVARGVLKVVVLGVALLIAYRLFRDSGVC